MSEEQAIPILPYSLIVGQEQLKLALEIAYVAPRIEGVLISGQRGTGKSTVVRAFSRMMYDRLPVTLPINATEDRVVGGWKIDALMQGKAEPQPGLLEEANGRLLFIDEVNLLDDHIVNIILDVAATGVLVVQREGLGGEDSDGEGTSGQKPVAFTLVGTMNPEEGGLRPQLLDRFGLVVSVVAEMEDNRRVKILNAVLAFDHAVRQTDRGAQTQLIKTAKEKDARRQAQLQEARVRFDRTVLSDRGMLKCVQLAKAFSAEGHRGDYITALAARACAALTGKTRVSAEHIRLVAPMALQHRRPEVLQRGRELWTEEDDRKLEQILNDGR